MNKNWARWIYASVSKHFVNNSNGVVQFIEGTDLDNRPQNFAEFRMDGPSFTELGGGEFRLWISVNILVQNTMDTNFHKKYRDYGDIMAAFADQIAVNKLGDGVDDDDSLLGCLTRLKDIPVRLSYFGQIDSEIRLEQATIEGRYEIFLS